MVLWEIALGTAWFMGLKRTHKLSLKLQRNLISPNHPKLRLFVQRRTRRVFDVAVGVHLKSQQMKVEIGNNIGNWIVRGLDRKKLSAANISGPRLITSTSNTATSIKKLMNDSADKVRLQNLKRKSEHLFTAARNMLPKATFPMVTMNKIMGPTRTAGSIIQYRHYLTGGIEHFTVDYRKFGFGDVVRNDIRQYLLCP